MDHNVLETTQQPLEREKKSLIWISQFESNCVQGENDNVKCWMNVNCKKR